MCFCVRKFICVCLIVGSVIKCGCCGKHVQAHQRRDTRRPIEQQLFLKKIFSKYGNNGVLNFEGFQSLLHNLGLEQIFHSEDSEEDHDHYSIEQHEHHEQHSQKMTQVIVTTSTTISESSSVGKDYSVFSKQTDVHLEKGHNDPTGSSIPEPFEMLSNLTSSEPDSMKCISATRALYSYQQQKQPDLDGNLSPIDFLNLCPAIIYDLQQHQCSQHLHQYSHGRNNEPKEGPAIGEVWLFATVAVVVISLCGLLSVALVPLVQKVFYQSLLQFLVGLAIGSLSGDALLHLLPHAMAGLTHHDHQGASSSGDGHGDHMETEAHMWHGLVALTGIYLFFAAEQLLTRVSSCFPGTKKSPQVERRTSLPKNGLKKQSSERLTRSSMHSLDPEQSRTVGEKLSHHKHGSYGYNFEQVELVDVQPPATEDSHKIEEASVSHETNLLADLEDPTETEDICSKDLKNDDETDGDDNISPRPFVNVVCVSRTEDAETVTVVKNGEQHGFIVAVPGHHHHHHHHHHSHSGANTSSSTVSAVAWMVIMGDGLHNFCDGLAIGAAFVSGLSSGLSTTIAVFCHELPHELGDFAMLLKAGMTLKQAFFYNALSSILCFLGMFMGITLGNIGSATLWIFSGAAGMFLYIALVDMLPELSTQEKGDSQCHHLFLQLLGIVLGIVIMLIIAIYEHDLRHLIS